MHPDSPEEIFAVFIFVERMCNALTTPYIPVDGHTPWANRRNDTKWRSEEASLYNNGLVFLLCGEICCYKSFRTAAVEGKSLK